MWLQGRAEECQCLPVEGKHLHPLSDKKILSARLDDETCAFYSQVQHQKIAEIQVYFRRVYINHYKMSQAYVRNSTIP